MKSTDIYNDLANFSEVGHNHSWGEISGKPSTFTPSSHNHNDLYAPIDQIVYTTTDPGNNMESSLEEGTLICVYEIEETSLSEEEEVSS